MRGFTLIEVMVSLAIGAFIAVASLTLTGEQLRVLDLTESRVSMSQEGRSAMELIAKDVRSAGLGVGYQADGTFAGLRRGVFSVAGGASFQADDFDVGNGLLTDDLGLRFTRGDVRTISDYNQGTGQVCAGGMFSEDELVLLMSRNGRTANSARILSANPDAGVGTVCVDGCETFTFVWDSTYSTDAGAQTATYDEGELFGDFQEVVYFATPDPVSGLSTLRRARIDTSEPCTSRSADCGVVVGVNIEAIQTRLWMFDEASQGWTDVTTDGDITEVTQLRLDVELVMRADSASDARERPVASALENGLCYPAGCGGEGDGRLRQILRSSIDIRNAGRMQIR